VVLFEYSKLIQKQQTQETGWTKLLKIVTLNKPRFPTCLNNMKAVLTIIFILILGFPATTSKVDMISQKWLEVGLKVFEKEYRPIDKQSAETLVFHKNGKMEKELYGNLKFKGIWKFSDDSMKIAIELTELNGNPVRGLSLSEMKPTDSILKLTHDTLILGTLKEYGNLRIHGHDDRYFVSVR